MSAHLVFFMTKANGGLPEQCEDDGAGIVDASQSSVVKGINVLKNRGTWAAIFAAALIMLARNNKVIRRRFQTMVAEVWSRSAFVGETIELGSAFGVLSLSW